MFVEWKIDSRRKVICAGCNNSFYTSRTTFYRNKRWCGVPECKSVIDVKVKHANYKKAQKKIKKGTFRNGVNPELRELIKTRDNSTCQVCSRGIEDVYLQVHHIIPVSNGGSDDVSNLILLCSSCHTTVHQTGWQEYTEMFFKYTNSSL